MVKTFIFTPLPSTHPCPDFPQHSQCPQQLWSHYRRARCVPRLPSAACHCRRLDGRPCVGGGTRCCTPHPRHPLLYRSPSPSLLWGRERRGGLIRPVTCNFQAQPLLVTPLQGPTTPARNPPTRTHNPALSPPNLTLYPNHMQHPTALTYHVTIFTA